MIMKLHNTKLHHIIPKSFANIVGDMLKSQFGQLKCDQNLLASQINGHVWNMHVTDWI